MIQLCNYEVITLAEDTKKTTENETELDALIELKRVVDLTRRIRMEASDRLISSEHFIQSINIYYSCFAVILSILCLFKDNEILVIISTVLTSILAISIVFLNAQHYGDRAQQFHDNFLELYQLLFEIKAAIRNKDYTQTRDLETRYIKLLKSTENHTQQDFFQILSRKDKTKSRLDEKYKKQLKGFSKLCFVGKRVALYVLKAIIWIFPIACIVFAICIWDAA